VKAECATRFRVAWQQVEHDADYARMKAEHREKYARRKKSPSTRERRLPPRC